MKIKPLKALEHEAELDGLKIRPMAWVAQANIKKEETLRSPEYMVGSAFFLGAVIGLVLGLLTAVVVAYYL